MDEEIDTDSNMELVECKRICAEYLDGWQRSKADYANFKKEVKEREQENVERVKARLIEKLLPVLESMDKAKVWIKDLGPIEAQLEKILMDFGLSMIGTMGEKFDPNIHESVESVDVDDENEDNTVAEVLSRGYRLAGRAIRPARVKVNLYKVKE